MNILNSYIEDVIKEYTNNGNETKLESEKSKILKTLLALIFMVLIVVKIPESQNYVMRLAMRIVDLGIITLVGHLLDSLLILILNT